MDINFGQRLKKLRIKAGLKQFQLAAQLGVSKSVVSYYELHERTPSPEIIVKLASIFHVSSDYLLGISSSPQIDVSGLSKKDIELIERLVDSLREKPDIEK